jgi:ribosomal protein S18 acetylase RimI-like enzyme
MADIKAARKEDIKQIAVCHRAAFQNSLSSALGLDYVSVMLGWYLSSDNTFLFFIEENGKCLGYCGGMVKTVWGVGSASSMAQYSFNTAVKAFIMRPWLIFHKEVRARYTFILKNIVNRFARKQKLNGDPTVVFEPYSGLVVIGVDSTFQGKGYGSLLLKEFERISKKKGLNKMVLSVRTENAQAIASYKRNGWGITQVNGKSTSMEKRLNDQ